MTRFECPHCGHKNLYTRRTCSQCQANLVKWSGAAPPPTAGDVAYPSEGFAILGGALLGALFFAALWLSLYDSIFPLLFGPQYYFNDFLIYVALPFSILLAMTPGIFCGAAVADFFFQRSHASWAASVNWGAVVTAVLAYLAGLLLAIAAFWILAFVPEYMPFPVWVLFAIPLVTLPTAVFIYLARTTARIED